jgi:hypothetical protein
MDSAIPDAMMMAWNYNESRRYQSKIETMYPSTEERDSWLLKSGLLVGITSLFLLMAGTVSAQEDSTTSFAVNGIANQSDLCMEDVTDNNARIGSHDHIARYAPSDAIAIDR